MFGVSKKTADVNMTEGSIAGKLIMFAIPVGASSILQQLFNMADVAVVGNFAGPAALAAVGDNTPVTSLFVSAFVALSLGANAMISRYVGQKRKDGISGVVHTSVLFSLLIGLFVFLFGQLIADRILAWIGTPAEVMDQAVLYLRIYLFGIPFIILYNFGAAILRSVGDSKRPMYVLVVSGVMNLIMNLLFVICLHMDVAGVALATTLSNVVAAFVTTWILMRETSEIHLSLHELRIEKRHLLSVLQIGAPAALQSAVFCVSNVCLQSGINSLGANCIAGSAAGLNLEYMSYYIVTAFNAAAVTFIGTNYGAGKYERCRKIFRILMLESCLVMFAFDVFLNVARVPLVRIFTADAEVASYAYIRLSHVVLFHMMISFYEITSSVMRGMGRSLVPALFTIIGCVCFRLLWLVTVFKAFHSFGALALVYPASWVVTSVLVLGCYFKLRRKMYPDLSM